MDDQALFDRQWAGLRAFCRLLGGASPDARVVEHESVLAAVVPAAPDRSVVNSVVYDRAPDLERALPELAETYAGAGVRAWTVWVPSADSAAAEILRDAGHALDAGPEAMAMELTALEAPRPTGLDLDPDPDVGTVARLNDRAYTFGSDDFERALRSAPALHCYVVRRDGEPVCCATGHDHRGDFSVTFVATLPEVRGQGLAGRLLTHALHDARERGCATTSLQATKAGEPLYRRLGYRGLGPVQMWERRATG